MALQGIAYGPDEHLLLTVDGAELLAHDAQTESPKWRLTLARPLVAIAFADSGALPGCERKSPWRDQAAGRFVIAVDEDGGLHAIDPATGQETGMLGPFGKPTALATGVGGLVALASEDKVFLWRSGELTEVASRASTALAFSVDGATLAVGAQDGSLRFLYVAGSTTPTETFCAVVHGGISDVVQHPGGSWIVAGRSGASTVTNLGPRRLEGIPAGLSRLALDARGARLAVQTADRAVVVYAWPNLGVELRVEYVERLVRGLSFGAADWLGVGLDHGDGNKIDVVTSATHRTDTHPGRTHRTWFLSVQGKATILSAKEAEDIRRMKTPFHVPVPDKGRGANGGRLGIGVVLTLAILGLRVCAATSRSSSYPTYTPTSYTSPTLPSLTAKCDTACATERLQSLQTFCATASSGCYQAASEAVTTFGRGDCKRAKAALARIDRADPLLTLAELGVAEACTKRASSKHGTLVRIEGAAQPVPVVTTEIIPNASPFAGEEPRTIWTAPDGTIFVGTMQGDTGSVVHRRDKTGVWEVVAPRRSRRPVQFWGKSATDLTIMDHDSLAHLDGHTKTEIDAPSRNVIALGGAGDDLFVVGESFGDAGSSSAMQVFRGPAFKSATVGALRSQPEWVVEPLPGGLTMRELWSNGGTVWGRGVVGDDGDGDDHVLQRLPNGRWIERRWGGVVPAKTKVAVQSAWVSPTGEAFVATSAGVFRSSGGGSAWQKTSAPVSKSLEPTNVTSLWGRSPSDVYAATSDGLMHYDGKSWSATAYTERVGVLGGTVTELLVLTTGD